MPWPLTVGFLFTLWREGMLGALVGLRWHGVGMGRLVRTVKIPTSRKGREKWGTRKIKVQINFKGNGRECPFHTGVADSREDSRFLVRLRRTRNDNGALRGSRRCAIQSQNPHPSTSLRAGFLAKCARNGAPGWAAEAAGIWGAYGTAEAVP
jgi:hypothetical protein